MSKNLLEIAPGFVRMPFTILIDTAEKAPFTFGDIVSRSFVDKEMRVYQPITERRFLGVGCGDYSIEGYTGIVGIERKSMKDFQGTLLGWRHEVEAGEWKIDIDRRARFKRELKTLAGFACKAVVVEATLDDCLDNSPEWGKRSAAENAKYLFSTYLSWVEEFPAVPWIFCGDRRFAEITTFRLLEKFWARNKKKKRESGQRTLAAAPF
jgi:hypothetical protein